MVAHGNSFAGYGGFDDNKLLEGSEAQWNQLGSKGVQGPSAAETQGQVANLNNSTAQQQQSQQQGYTAMGLMQAQAMGAQTPAMQQAAATQQYGANAARAMSGSAGGPAALAAARQQSATAGATQYANNANQNRALAAQEQQTGMQQYGQMADAMRGNAQQMYGDQNSAALQAAQQQEGLNSANDQLMLGYSNMGQSAEIAQQQQILGNSKFNMDESQQNFNNSMKTAGAIDSAFMSGVGGAADAWGNSGGGGGGGGNTSGDSYNPSGNGDGYSGDFSSDVQNSDIRKKTDIITDGHRGLMSPFLDTLSASRSMYRYKDPSDEPRVEPTGGHYAGIMAQDLERVPNIGHQLVHDTPTGKYVDSKTLLSAIAAGLGDVHERVRSLESNREYDNG